MDSFSIFIPGVPHPWDVAYNKVTDRFYNPSSIFKRKARELIKSKYEAPLMQGEIHLCFRFQMPMPKGSDEQFHNPHLKKPDLTNLQKLYEDALQGVVFENDCCVTYCQSLKIYSRQVGVKIEVLNPKFFMFLDIEELEDRLDSDREIYKN